LSRDGLWLIWRPRLPDALYVDMYHGMNGRRARAAGSRRVTANLPKDLLGEACRATGKGITETLVEGLERVRRSGAAVKARKLKGRIKLDVDLEISRERARH
jgi:hypothetical protein